MRTGGVWWRKLLMEKSPWWPRFGGLVQESTSRGPKTQRNLVNCNMNENLLLWRQSRRYESTLWNMRLNLDKWDVSYLSTYSTPSTSIVFKFIHRFLSISHFAIMESYATNFVYVQMIFSKRLLGNQHVDPTTLSQTFKFITPSSIGYTKFTRSAGLRDRFSYQEFIAMPSGRWYNPLAIACGLGYKRHWIEQSASGASRVAVR